MQKDELQPIQPRESRPVPRAKTMLTESQFKNRPKLRDLSKREKQQRWEQHLASEGLNVTRATNRRVRGRGAYTVSPTSIVGRVARSARQAAGTIQRYGKKYVPAGTFRHVGSAFAGAPGGAAGAALSSMVGFGDYVPKTNSLIHGLSAHDRASFGDGSKYHVKRRDFIGEVRAPATPTAFNMTVYPLQITNPMTFPWGAPIGRNFAEWELIGCIVEYVPTSSGYAANTAMGKVAIATEYNSNQTMWSDMRQLCNAEGAISVKPSDPMSHGIECDPELTNSEKLYTYRSGSSGALNLYDHGQVGVATEGLTAPADTILGEIWIAYEVALRKPELAPTMPFSEGYGTTLQYDAAGSGATLAAPDTLPGPTCAVKHGIIFTASLPTTQCAGTMMCLQPQVGPAPEPNIPIANIEYLCGWVNNDTVSRTTTHFTFRVPGIYYFEVIYAFVQQVPALPAGLCSMVPFGGAHVGWDINTNVGFGVLSQSTTSSSVIWRYRIETLQTNGGISLTNTGTALTTPQRTAYINLVCGKI